MAKITKTEFLDNIQNILTEGMTPNIHIDHTKKFEIGPYIAGLFESGQRDPKLMNFLNNYNNLLNSGSTKEYMLYEQFGKDLAKYAVGNKEVKNVINEMNNTLKEYGNELEAYRLIECIQNPATQCTVRDAYDHYLDAGDEDSCNILIDAIDLCKQEHDPVGQKLMIIITTDGQEMYPQIELDGQTESKFEEIQRKIKEDKERKRLEDVKAKVDAYARQVFDEASEAKRAEKDACSFESIINNNGINLHESIKNIASSDAKSNKKLMETLEQYANALNQGLYEERLYEGFLNNISKFNYLLPVEKEIKRINEVASKKSGSIMVTKILEEMTNSTSYYIVPLIEEDAVRYVKNPNDINRAQLRSALCSFASDPYCKAILEAIDRDGLTIAETIDEKAISFKDQVKMIRENANVSAIYSPVQYIKENECIFNANGQFYVKKGNTLSKLSDEYLNQLSESFITLCQLVNDPHVSINKDSITLYGNQKIANIYEGYAEVNGNKETQESLRALNEMGMKYDYDTNFFIMASCLLENFNNIANVNFGKHVALNTNEGVNVDMFRLGNNIFVNAVNEDMLKSTFYHNVNPIQCRNIINKHMGINVASLFEDLLPSQDKIIMKLNETKNEYEDSIEKYEAAIEKLKAAKEDCSSEENEKKLDSAIKSAEKKVEDLKKEYKDWQMKAEASIDADAAEEAKNAKKEKKADKDTEKKIEDDPNTDVEKSNEPIDADDVESVKGELSQPMTIEGEEDPTISDAEFDSYLDSEDEPIDDEETIDSNIEEDEPIEEDPEEEIASEEDEEPEVEDAFDEVKLDDDQIDSEESEEDDEYPFEEETEDEPIEEEPSENFELPEEAPKANVEEVSVPEGYKIANITFDQNLKTGELFKTGSITVICPMVSNDGHMYVTSNNYNFYIDNETHLPIIDAADIPVALYNALVASIQQDDQYIKADSEGIADEVEEGDPKASELFYDAKDVKAASDELEKDDDEAMFDFSEDPEGESFTISAKEEEPKEVEKIEVDDEPEEISISKILGNFDEDEEDSEEPVIPTYKSGKTEIELPAPNADKTEIPEISAEEAKKLKAPSANVDKVIKESKSAKAPKSKISLNEARKSFVKLQAEYNKGGQRFFLSEGTIKPSKKEDAHVNETFDGVDLNGEDPMNEPIEDYNEYALTIMQARAAQAARAAGSKVKVSDIQHNGAIDYFIISNNNNNVYVVFVIDNKIYYRDANEFDEIINNAQMLKINPAKFLIFDGDDEMDYIDVNDVDAAKDLVNTIMLSIDLKCLAVDENVKIKRPSLKTDEFKDSKQADDILHGDAEKRKFEKDVEEESQKAGIDNPLAPAQQQESIKILPNAHSLQESKVEDKNLKLVYQPEDWVIIKETGMRAQVINVVNNDKGELTMLTILASDGHAYDVEDLSEIEPDPLYLENVPGRTINSQNLNIPRMGEFDIDHETRMPRPLENEKLPKDWHRDLNGKTTPVFIVVEGQRLTSTPVSALMEDIANSNKTIRIINEDDSTTEYDKDNIEFTDMPYAVIVDSEGKPVRSIQIDAKNYIETEEDGMVDCLVDGKITKFPKKCINVIS